MPAPGSEVITLGPLNYMNQQIPCLPEELGSNHLQ